MKVCVLTTVLDTFKGGSHLPLMEACSDIEFTILTNRTKSDQGALPSNITVVTLNQRIGSYYYGFADFLFARSVLKAYPPDDPFWKQFDLIHCNQVMGPALKKLTKLAIPFLFLIHHPVTADKEVATTESGFGASILWQMKYSLLVRWQRALCHAASRIVTVSQTMQHKIAEDYGCNKEKIDVVLNGVDSAVFTPVPDTECTFDIIAVGSFAHPRKGFRYLLEVYQRLASSGMKIADVGRRSTEQLTALQAIEGVTVHGTVDQDTLVHLVRHSRTLVSTSLFEGFGLSLIEALACGHPAFAFTVGAVPEVLGSIDRTLLFPPRDTAAMISAAQNYLELSPEKRERQGVEYRKMVQSRYSLATSAIALQSVYNKLTS